MNRIHGVCLELVLGDLTQQDTDAIVNAANTSLLGGGGVDGAIHRMGGPTILEACKKLGGCKTGDAKLTPGGRLKARYVIHTVGPIYRGGIHHEAEQLASCYCRSLEVALAHGIETIAFPSISTGAYGYPVEAAARIAVEAVQAFLASHSGIQCVRFVLFDKKTYEAYAKALN
ncbi:MAG: O-acetyl-ADP-ribose deacetylase [bacterium]|jgi:O-acetyl-ADP-ribose deacetylase (regulator of RNase III)|nr:O-acetyl-ADP-ribose deacetylase [bacterium]